jgi:hypothetical protein
MEQRSAKFGPEFCGGDGRRRLHRLRKCAASSEHSFLKWSLKGKIYEQVKR